MLLHFVCYMVEFFDDPHALRGNHRQDTLRCVSGRAASRAAYPRGAWERSTICVVTTARTTYVMCRGAQRPGLHAHAKRGNDQMRCPPLLQEGRPRNDALVLGRTLSAIAAGRVTHMVVGNAATRPS
jgi:hypothetical protein